MGKTGTRIYRVKIDSREEVRGFEIRLIRATSKFAAERHAFKDKVEAVRATQNDLVELLEDGIKVEEAGVSVDTSIIDNRSLL
jgi:hypothetical protein